MRLIKKWVVYLIKRLGYKISREIRPPSLDSIAVDITYLDVGSSGGLPSKWSRYKEHHLFNAILVEPDIKAAEELRMMYPNARVIPHALGKIEENAILNLTQCRACSSILVPNMEVLERFPVVKWFK